MTVRRALANIVATNLNERSTRAHIKLTYKCITGGVAALNDEGREAYLNLAMR